MSKSAFSTGVDWSLFGGAESVRSPSSATDPTLSLSTSSSSASSSQNTHPSSRDVSPVISEKEPEEIELPLDLRERKGDQWAPKMIGIPQDPNDWLWLMTEEPHRSRRKAILKDHPEVMKLMGYTPWTKWVTLAIVTLQLCIAAYFGKAVRSSTFSPYDWRLFVTAYAIGGTANQNLFLAIHEITHNLAFPSIRANRYLAMFANLPIGVPYAMLFKPYHLEHHKHLGEDGIDTDLPTRLELLFLRNVAGKAFFATMQIFFYALRPGFVKAQRITAWVIANFAVQFLMDYIMAKLFGGASIWYLLLSSFFAGSLHPCAAHFIAEHYIWQSGGEQETWSYYGPLNLLAYNVGYHNEHHDFPSIPWTRLPKLRQIAAEYYDPLPHHESWPMVTIKFIFDPNVGIFSRVKRHAKPARTDVCNRPRATPSLNAPHDGVERGLIPWSD